MQLQITAGPDAGKTIEPAGERFTVGREGVDFLLADDEVSRRHIELRTPSRRPASRSPTSVPATGPASTASGSPARRRSPAARRSGSG